MNILSDTCTSAGSPSEVDFLENPDLLLTLEPAVRTEYVRVSAVCALLSVYQTHEAAWL